MNLIREECDTVLFPPSHLFPRARRDRLARGRPSRPPLPAHRYPRFPSCSLAVGRVRAQRLTLSSSGDTGTAVSAALPQLTEQHRQPTGFHGSQYQRRNAQSQRLCKDTSLHESHRLPPAADPKLREDTSGKDWCPCAQFCPLSPWLSEE